MSPLDFILWFFRTGIKLAFFAVLFGGGYYYVTQKSTPASATNGQGNVGGIGGIGNGNNKSILTP